MIEAQNRRLAARGRIVAPQDKTPQSDLWSGVVADERAARVEDGAERTQKSWLAPIMESSASSWDRSLPPEEREPGVWQKPCYRCGLDGRETILAKTDPLSVVICILCGWRWD